MSSMTLCLFAPYARQAKRKGVEATIGACG